MITILHTTSICNHPLKLKTHSHIIEGYQAAQRGGAEGLLVMDSLTMEMQHMAPWGSLTKFTQGTRPLKIASRT